jgi:hypothetical protein
MQAESSVALKEWAVLCALLGAGRHSVLLRKGGLREPRSEPGAPATFSAAERRFWLLPTYFHAREAGRERDLADDARALLPDVLASAPPPGRLRIDLFAEACAVFDVRERARIDALAGLHGLSPTCVDARFTYRRPGLCVMVLRTWRTRQPLDLPDLAEYAGCVSWVDLAAPAAADLEPVLSDDAHAARLAAVRAALEAA